MTQEIKMKSFVAIDFETANQYRSSVCSVGVVVVKDNKIIDKFYSLIHPAPNYYSYWNTQVHGLTIDSTQSAPNFPDVWAKVSPLIGDLPLVAHNSSFDESCLKAVFRKLPESGFSRLWNALPELYILLHLQGFKNYFRQ